MPDTSESQTSIAAISAIAGAAIAGIPALGVWILNLLKTRRELSQQQRADALAEWQEIVGVLQKDLTTIKTELEECHSQHAIAQKRMGEMSGEILVLKTLFNKKRTGVHPPVQKPNEPNEPNDVT